MVNSSGTIVAEPEPITLDLSSTALLIIDMQRDFMEPGGFGETLGNDVSQLARAVKPIGAVLSAARDTGMLVIHTREGHLPDLSDAPPAKVQRGAPSMRIGDPGPMGRILIRGEAGQGRVLRHRARRNLAEIRYRKSAGVRRDHRGLRQHISARGQRPRLSLRRHLRRLRVLFPG